MSWFSFAVVKKLKKIECEISVDFIVGLELKGVVKLVLFLYQAKNYGWLSGSPGTKNCTQVMAAVCSYGGCGLNGCVRNGDLQLRCYLFFYIWILEDFSHADE